MKYNQITNKLFEKRLFIQRSVVAGFLIFAGFLVLSHRMFGLQVLKHDYFQTQSKKNRIRIEPLAPTRGLIYDRNNILLAENIPSFSLVIMPELLKNKKAEQGMLTLLAQYINLSEDDLKRYHKQRHQQRFRRFKEIPIKTKLTDKELAHFSVNNHLFPSVKVVAKLIRNYPYGNLTAHVLGYVGRINKKELKKINTTTYAATTHIGKNGIEASYETELHGQVGYQKVEVNVLGKVIRVLEKKLPVSGKDLKLTFDSHLQKIAQAAFKGQKGALVAIDPRDGGVLVLLSYPSFDSNLFVEGISSKNYRALLNSPHRPLFNRAIRGTYPPGSTVKPFIGLAGLENQVTHFNQKTFCRGYYQLPKYKHKYRCWKKRGHGRVNMQTAIIQSCDVYFYDLAVKLGIDRLHDFLSKFHFGQKTGIDLVGEKRAILPSRAWKKKRKGVVWYPGETVNTGIGQGYFTVTPLQLASATAALANGGLYIIPHLLMESSGKPYLKKAKKIPLKSKYNLQNIQYAMLQVIEGARGTAKRIRSTKYQIAGKTGTAQVFSVAQDKEYKNLNVSKKNQDHALFVTYAPVDKPTIAIGIIVENAGHGGSVAAPIAKKVMDAWILGGK